jgi:hypothetical protein
LDVITIVLLLWAFNIICLRARSAEDFLLMMLEKVLCDMLSVCNVILGLTVLLCINVRSLLIKTVYVVVVDRFCWIAGS